MIIFIVFIQKNNFINHKVLLTISFIFSLAYLSIYSKDPINSAPFILGDKRLYFMFIFFYFGYCIRNNIIKLPFSKNILIKIITVLSLLRIFDFFIHFSSLLSASIYIFLNILLIDYVFTLVNSSDFIWETQISFLGINSLPIYLWHPLPILLMQHFQVDVRLPLLFYSVAVVFILMLIYFLKFIHRSKVWNIILFGNT